MSLRNILVFIDILISNSIIDNIDLVSEYLLQIKPKWKSFDKIYLSFYRKRNNVKPICRFRRTPITLSVQC